MCLLFGGRVNIFFFIALRFVTRESSKDDNEETPSEGSSTDSESNDGDRDSFSQRKEDRYIDYYTVPRCLAPFCDFAPSRESVKRACVSALLRVDGSLFYNV